MSASTSVASATSQTYTFQLKTAGRVLANSYLQLQFSRQIEVPDTVSTANSCRNTAGFSGMISCSISGSTLRVNSGFATLYSGGTQATALTFTLAGITNPRSTKPVTDFTFTLFSSDDNQEYTGSGSITMQNPSNFAAATVRNQQQKNGLQNKYTFEVTSPATVKPGEFYRVTIPDDMAFSSSPTCGGNNPLATTLTCQKQSNTQVIITITRADSASTDIAKNTELTFTIENIRNPPALQTSRSMTITQILESGGTKYSVSIQSSSLTVQNTSLADLASVSVGVEDTKIAAKAQLTFSFASPVTFIPQGTVLTLTIPSTLSFNGNLACSGTSGIASRIACRRPDSTHTIEIAGGWPQSSINSNTSIAFSISDGLKNALSSGQTSSFALNMKDSNGNSIANIDSSITLTFTCDSSCRTCSAEPTNCQTCITSTSLKYFHNNKCLSECPAGFYQNDDSTPRCDQCVSPCMTCSTSSSTCLSCDPAALLKNLHGSTCVQNCPDKTFASSNQCKNCVSPCNTCSESSTKCLSCDGSSQFKFLNAETCLASCPDGKIQVGNKCEDCLSPCATCQGVQTRCLTCITGQLLYANTCVQTCPSGFTPDTTGATCILVVQQKDQVLYFPVLALFIFLFFLVLIIKLACRDVMFIKSFLMVQATVQVGSWFFMLYFLIRDEHWISSALVGGAIVGHILCNLLVICMHKSIAKKDKMFNKYRERYKKTYKCTYVYSILISHKFYRHIQSFFVRKKSLKVVLEKKKRIINPMTMITFLSIFITSLPIIGACILNIFFNTVFLQLFYTDIEVATITATMIAFQVADATIENKKFNKKIEQQKKLRFDENVKLIDAYKNDKSQNSISAVSYEEQNFQFLKLMMGRLMRKNQNDYFISQMGDQEQALNKGYHSEDEGQWRRRADRFKNQKQRSSSFPATPRTKERTEKNFLMMQMLEDGDIGNLGDMQSVFLKTGGKWATKRFPPSRGLEDFAITQAQGQMMFPGQRNQRPDSTIYRARQQELQKREAEVDQKNKRGEEILQAIKKQREELQKLKNSHILRSGKNSPVGPLIIPAPFTKQGQGSAEDQQKSIAKGRRSSMDKTSTLFLRKSNMSDTMSGYNGSRQGSARGIESPIHSDRTISEKNMTGMSGRNSRVQLIPQGPAFIGVVPVSDSRQHTKTNFSNIEREDEEQKLPRNMKQQASIKSFKNNNKSLRSNKYSTDNLSNTLPIQSHKVLPSIKSNKRLSPVQSPKQNQKFSLKAKSIIDSSSGLIHNGSMDPSVAADSSTALVKQIAQSSARQGIQSEQQGNNYLPPVPIQTSADEEDRNGSTKQNENLSNPRKEQNQQMNKGYDTVDQKIISDVQLQQAKGQEALLNNRSFDNQQQNNTSSQFPGVIAFPRGGGQGASKSPRSQSQRKSVKSNSKINNSKALSKSQSKKQLNNSQSSSKIGNKNLKSNKKKTVQRPSPRHLFDKDAMTVPIIENQNSKSQKLRNEIENQDEPQSSNYQIIDQAKNGQQLINPSVAANDKKETKLKNKAPDLNKSYVSDAPQDDQQNNDSQQPNPMDALVSESNPQKDSRPSRHQVHDLLRQPIYSMQQGPKNQHQIPIKKSSLPLSSQQQKQENSLLEDIKQKQQGEQEEQANKKDLDANFDNQDDDPGDEDQRSQYPNKTIKTSPPKKENSFSIENDKAISPQQQIRKDIKPVVTSNQFQHQMQDSNPPHQAQNNSSSKSKKQESTNLKSDQQIPPSLANIMADQQKKPKFNNGKQDPLDDSLIAQDHLLYPQEQKGQTISPIKGYQMTEPPYKSDRVDQIGQNESPIKGKGFQVHVERVQHSAHSGINSEMQITPTQFTDENSWRKHRMHKPPSKSQQIQQRRVGGGGGGGGGVGSGIAPQAYPTNYQYHSPSLQFTNGGMTPIVHPIGGFIPFSARPAFGATSVSPVIQQAGVFSLEDIHHFNGFNRKQGELAASVVGGFEPIDPIKGSASPMLAQQPYRSNTDGRNSAQNGQLFYPNRSEDEQIQSNNPLSSRNQVIPLNPGLAQIQGHGYPSPNYNFGFQPSFGTNLNYIQQVGGRKPVRHQAPKTGQEFYNNNNKINDLMGRAYLNPTQFQRQVLQGHKPSKIFHPAVDMQVNKQEAKYEIFRSDKKKQKKKSKANLRDQSDKGISVAPPGGMRNLLSKRLIGLQNAYFQKPLAKKNKSKANLKTLETPRQLLNNQLGTHISPPHGEPPMSRMSPIPPNHNNYAFSPRK